MSFTDQLRAFSRKTDQRMEHVVRESVLELADVIIAYSPWGDWPAWSESWQKKRPQPPYEPGLFRGAWVYSYGAPSTEFPGTIDPTGELFMTRIRQELQIAGGVHYLCNNTPYAKLMETGANLVGHNVGLGHMLEMTRASFESVVYAVVRRNQ